ncbi:MAG: glutathione peroxidase [Reichenbachiella sp.]
MKTIVLISALTFLLGGDLATSFYDFKIQALDSEEEINFADFKGKKVLVVNVASKCGYTPQYKDLQALSQRYSDKLVVIGLPCDQFMGQELNEESLIKEFCTGEYNVTFPMTSVVEVKGKNQHPIYKWLTNKDQNGKDDYSISWNFNKFMIDEEGNLLEYYGSGVEPFSEEIVKYLK